MIYWIVYISSILFTYFALRIKKKFRGVRILFFLLAVFSPCILAGMRGNYIGTDMQIYILPLYKIARSSLSFEMFVSSALEKLAINDILYLIVTYLAAKVFDSRTVLLFMNEVLVVLPIYIALNKDNENRYSITMGMFIFYCFMYNASFNMVRQSIALSFEILALSYLNDNSNKKFVLFVIISAMFHSTAVIILIVYFIFWFYKTDIISNKLKKILLIIALMLAGIIAVNIVQISNIANAFGIISEKRFRSLQFWMRDADFSYVNTFFYLMILFIISLNYKFLMTMTLKTKVYRYLLVMGIILLQVGVFVTFADRIAYYFIYPVIFLLLPKITVENLKRVPKKRFVSTLFIMALFLGHWVYWIRILNYHDTLPYIFFNGVISL